MIDLTCLINYSRDKIDLDGDKELDLDKYHSDDIKDLSRLTIKGKIVQK